MTSQSENPSPHKVRFYLPGTIVQDGSRGRYPAVSITGEACGLMCEHCAGMLLKNMIPAADGRQLVDLARKLAASGQRGMLISGGCDLSGALPWRKEIFDAIRTIKSETNLHISAHTGINVDPRAALELKASGVDQALIDVLGDPETFSRVYHLDNWEMMKTSLDNLARSGLEIVPHIVAGLLFGRISGEHHALEMIDEIRESVRTVVMVIIMPLSGTPMFGAPPPPLEEVEKLFKTARGKFPDKFLSLGCARPVGEYGHRLERMALELKFDKIAVCGRKGADYARKLGFDSTFEDTCCCLDFD